MRPWPGAPGCWPRLRSERGFSCCSLLLPKRAFCSTDALARSLAYCASNFSIRVWEAFAILLSRRIPFESDLIVFFWRRDLLSATRSSVVLSDNAFVSVSLAARCLAAWALTASNVRTALRSRRISFDCDLIVCFWRHDLLSAARS